MPILPFRGIWPTIADDAFIADSAYVIGDVTIGAGSSVWYGAVVRGDMAPIRIGARTNIQDGSVVHVDTDVPTIIGDDVVIGHGAIVHGATVGNGCMIAMRATVMNRSVIGDGAIIGAGAILTQDKTVPARMLRPATWRMARNTGMNTTHGSVPRLAGRSDINLHPTAQHDAYTLRLASLRSPAPPNLYASPRSAKPFAQSDVGTLRYMSSHDRVARRPCQRRGTCTADKTSLLKGRPR
ncbi:MAG: gamma carbonic anhydrase family protein [Chloroflexi bacterium]|nr:gamma carbonic anhydrase family protein [Chloroflexota bacterium]